MSYGGSQQAGAEASAALGSGGGGRRMDQEEGAGDRGGRGGTYIPPHRRTNDGNGGARSDRGGSSWRRPRPIRGRQHATTSATSAARSFPRPPRVAVRELADALADQDEHRGVATDIMARVLALRDGSPSDDDVGDVLQRIEAAPPAVFRQRVEFSRSYWFSLRFYHGLLVHGVAATFPGADYCVLKAVVRRSDREALLTMADNRELPIHLVVLHSSQADSDIPWLCEAYGDNLAGALGHRGGQGNCAALASLVAHAAAGTAELVESLLSHCSEDDAERLICMESDLNGMQLAHFVLRRAWDRDLLDRVWHPCVKSTRTREGGIRTVMDHAAAGGYTTLANFQYLNDPRFNDLSHMWTLDEGETSELSQYLGHNKHLQTEVVQWLTEQYHSSEAVLTHRGRYGLVPLHRLAMNSYATAEVVNQLVNMCPKTLLMAADTGESPIAAGFGWCPDGTSLEAMRALLAACPPERVEEQLTSTSEHGFTPLHWAAVHRCGDAAVLDCLAKATGDLDALLHTSHDENSRSSLMNGADGGIPLFWAASLGRARVTRWLFDRTHAEACAATVASEPPTLTKSRAHEHEPRHREGDRLIHILCRRYKEQQGQQQRQQADAAEQDNWAELIMAVVKADESNLLVVNERTDEMPLLLLAGTPLLDDLNLPALPAFVHQVKFTSVRLHLCGDELAGKTSLRVRLTGGVLVDGESPAGDEQETIMKLQDAAECGPASQAMQDSRTLGAEAFRVRLPRPAAGEEEPEPVWLYDHGGQKRFHVMHSSLFSGQRSVFALMIPTYFVAHDDMSGTADQWAQRAQEALTQWLSMLDTLAHPDSVILVLCNEWCGDQKRHPAAEQRARANRLQSMLTSVLASRQAHLDAGSIYADDADVDIAEEAKAATATGAGADGGGGGASAALQMSAARTRLPAVHPSVISTCVPPQTEDCEYSDLLEQLSLTCADLRAQLRMPELCRTVIKELELLRRESLKCIYTLSELFERVQSALEGEHGAQTFKLSHMAALAKFLQDCGEVFCIDTAQGRHGASERGRERVVINPHLFCSQILGPLFSKDLWQDRRSTTDYVMSADQLCEQLNAIDLRGSAGVTRSAAEEFRQDDPERFPELLRDLGWCVKVDDDQRGEAQSSSSLWLPLFLLEGRSMNGADVDRALLTGNYFANDPEHPVWVRVGRRVQTSCRCQSVLLQAFMRSQARIVSQCPAQQSCAAAVADGECERGWETRLWCDGVWAIRDSRSDAHLYECTSILIRHVWRDTVSDYGRTHAIDVYVTGSLHEPEDWAAFCAHDDDAGSHRLLRIADRVTQDILDDLHSTVSEAGGQLALDVLPLGVSDGDMLRAGPFAPHTRRDSALGYLLRGNPQRELAQVATSTDETKTAAEEEADQERRAEPERPAEHSIAAFLDARDTLYRVIEALHVPCVLATRHVKHEEDIDRAASDDTEFPAPQNEDVVGCLDTMRQQCRVFAEHLDEDEDGLKEQLDRLLEMRRFCCHHTQEDSERQLDADMVIQYCCDAEALTKSVRKMVDRTLRALLVNKERELGSIQKNYRSMQSRDRTPANEVPDHEVGVTLWQQRLDGASVLVDRPWERRATDYIRLFFDLAREILYKLLEADDFLPPKTDLQALLGHCLNPAVAVRLCERLNKWSFPAYSKCLEKLTKIRNDWSHQRLSDVVSECLGEERRLTNDVIEQIRLGMRKQRRSRECTGKLRDVASIVRLTVDRCGFRWARDRCLDLCSISDEAVNATAAHREALLWLYGGLSKLHSRFGEEGFFRGADLRNAVEAAGMQDWFGRFTSVGASVESRATSELEFGEEESEVFAVLSPCAVHTPDLDDKIRAMLQSKIHKQGVRVEGALELVQSLALRRRRIYTLPHLVRHCQEACGTGYADKIEAWLESIVKDVRRPHLTLDEYLYGAEGGTEERKEEDEKKNKEDKAIVDAAAPALDLGSDPNHWLIVVGQIRSCRVSPHDAKWLVARVATTAIGPIGQEEHTAVIMRSMGVNDSFVNRRVAVVVNKPDLPGQDDAEPPNAVSAEILCAKCAADDAGFAMLQPPEQAELGQRVTFGGEACSPPVDMESMRKVGKKKRNKRWQDMQKKLSVSEDGRVLCGEAPCVVVLADGVALPVTCRFSTRNESESGLPEDPAPVAARATGAGDQA